MARPRVIVVGLGPSDETLLTRSVQDLLEGSEHVVFRTLRHPAASAFGDAESFDSFYERFETFDEVYEAIVTDLIMRAQSGGEVIYCVPGSPLVAERTVELLRERGEIDVQIRPALSFADVAFAALGIDPMNSGVRFVDATEIGARLRGPGPLLLTQCYSTAVLSDIKLSVDSELMAERPTAVILHHLGLEDEEIVPIDLDEIDRFSDVDHLTSLYIPELRTIGPAAEDLVDLMERLRLECPWDQKQTHESLTRHLLEESYELLEALENLSHAESADVGIDEAYDHLQEELGDVVFQVVFHAHLAAEAGQFSLTDVFDGVRLKLIGRHPHVFADVTAETADEVAANWEVIKRAEKNRTSVTDGIPSALPALTRFVKLRRKANAIAMAGPTILDLQEQLQRLTGELSVFEGDIMDDSVSTAAGERADLVASILELGVELAQLLGVDPETVLRQRADRLTASIVEFE